MKVTSHDISSHYETLSHMVDLAVKYRKDSLLFPQRTIRQLYDFLQSRYRTEETETLMRPKYYLSDRFFGDCDDYSIAFISWLIHRERFHLNDIWLVLCGRKQITHVFPIYEVDYPPLGKFLIGLDALPQNQFGIIYTYPHWIAYNCFDLHSGIKRPFTLKEWYALQVENSNGVTADFFHKK